MILLASLKTCIMFFLLGVLPSYSSAELLGDCQVNENNVFVPTTSTSSAAYKPIYFHTEWEGTMFYGYLPQSFDDLKSDAVTYPVIVFHHGHAAGWEYYSKLLEQYSMEGYIAIFPFIKDPVSDTSTRVTSTNGDFVLKSMRFVIARLTMEGKRNKDTSLWNPFQVLADTNAVVAVGHSMGATASINGAYRFYTETELQSLRDVIKLKAVIAQHPGICGPFGPPPLPYTWTKAKLQTIRENTHVLFTTATNDDAFLPMPNTAKYEHNCYVGSTTTTSKKKDHDSDVVQQLDSIFIEFTTEACTDDNKMSFSDGGHNCALKLLPTSSEFSEASWVLPMIKLYTHLNGNSKSQCYNLLFGDKSMSLTQSKHVQTLEIDLKKPDSLMFRGGKGLNNDKNIFVNMFFWGVLKYFL